MLDKFEGENFFLSHNGTQLGPRSYSNNYAYLYPPQEDWFRELSPRIRLELQEEITCKIEESEFVGWSGGKELIPKIVEDYGITEKQASYLFNIT